MHAERGAQRHACRARSSKTRMPSEELKDTSNTCMPSEELEDMHAERGAQRHAHACRARSSKTCMPSKCSKTREELKDMHGEVRSQLVTVRSQLVTAHTPSSGAIAGTNPNLIKIQVYACLPMGLEQNTGVCLFAHGLEPILYPACPARAWRTGPDAQEKVRQYAGVCLFARGAGASCVYVCMCVCVCVLCA